MKEILKDEAGNIYEGVRGHYVERLESLELFISAYTETDELDNLEKDEVEQMMPQILKEQEMIRDVVGKLNSKATYDWFVGEISTGLDAEVTEEEAALLADAIVIQQRVDTIFEKGTSNLVEFLTKDLNEKVVVN